MVDIVLNNKKGYYDFDIINGDFEKSESLDTSVVLSLGTNARASESEVPVIYRRRGWWGNLILPVLLSLDFELGSKLWLLEQARMDIFNIAKHKAFSEEALFWYQEDGYVDRLLVGTEGLTETKLRLTIEMFLDNNLLVNSTIEVGRAGAVI